MEPIFSCTSVETQRDFLEVAYKISFAKKVLWTVAQFAGGAACIAAYFKNIGNYLLPCGIVLLALGLFTLTWPLIRALTGYRTALKRNGGTMKPSYVEFGKEIVNETPNGTLRVPYDTVQTIHFLKDSFVIEDKRGLGVLVSKRGFTKGQYMDCINFLCEQCSNLEL